MLGYDPNVAGDVDPKMEGNVTAVTNVVTSMHSALRVFGKNRLKLAFKTRFDQLQHKFPEVAATLHKGMSIDSYSNFVEWWQTNAEPTEVQCNYCWDFWWSPEAMKHWNGLFLRWEHEIQCCCQMSYSNLNNQSSGQSRGVGFIYHFFRHMLCGIKKDVINPKTGSTRKNQVRLCTINDRRSKEQTQAEGKRKRNKIKKRDIEFDWCRHVKRVRTVPSAISLDGDEEKDDGRSVSVSTAITACDSKVVADLQRQLILKEKEIAKLNRTIMDKDTEKNGDLSGLAVSHELGQKPQTQEEINQSNNKLHNQFVPPVAKNLGAGTQPITKVNTMPSDVICTWCECASYACARNHQFHAQGTGAAEKKGTQKVQCKTTVDDARQHCIWFRHVLTVNCQCLHRASVRPKRKEQIRYSAKQQWMMRGSTASGSVMS